MLRIMLISIALMLLTGIAAADDDDLAPVSIQLQWVTQAQFAGYYVALALGYYEDEGLDVTILESEGDIQPADAVAAGDAEFGVTWLPKTLIANEQGADLVNIAQIFQRSGTVLVSLADAGIESITDLVHKRVGYWPNDNEFEVYATTFVMGSDPISGEHLLLVEQPFDLVPLLDGELDAAQALIYNWYGRLLGKTNPATGELYREADLNIIDMNAIGTAMLQDHIIARRLSDSRLRRGSDLEIKKRMAGARPVNQCPCLPFDAEHPARFQRRSPGSQSRQLPESAPLRLSRACSNPAGRPFSRPNVPALV